MATPTFKPLVIWDTEFLPKIIRCIYEMYDEFSDTMMKPGEQYDESVKDYDQHEEEILDYIREWDAENCSVELNVFEHTADVHKPKKIDDLKVALVCEFVYLKCLNWLDDNGMKEICDQSIHERETGIRIVKVNKITQKSLNNLFNIELFTVDEVNELIQSICHFCRDDDAAKDEIMELIDKRYPQFNEDRVHETTEILFDFIDGHLEYEEDK